MFKLNFMKTFAKTHRALNSTINFIRNLFLLPWPLIWAGIYLTILVLGLLGPDSSTLMIIRLSGILLCLAYTVIRFPSDRLLQFALLATCVADLILAVNNTAEIGIFVFLVAQVLHLIRLTAGQSSRVPLIIFCAIGLIALAGNLYYHNVQIIYVICGFYLATLLMNIYFSYQWRLRSPENPYAFMALLGFILFACCDTCTAVSYLSLNGFLAFVFYAPANYFAWLFYYPSQIFVSNSPRLAKKSPQIRENMLKCT